MMGCCIVYTLFDVDPPEISSLRRCIAKIPWNTVAARLSDIVPDQIPKQWLRASLDAALIAISSSIQDTLNEFAPLTPTRTRSSHWWTPDCSDALEYYKKAHLLARKRRTLGT